jgi:Protein of unknown function (DUF3365)
MRHIGAMAALLVFATVAPAQDKALQAPVEESRRIALQVSQDHRAQLIKEMQSSGPLRALLVCKYGCAEITSSQSRKTGWKISMVSLKPRNSGMGMADVWEQRVLYDFERRAANGEKADALEYAEIVSEPQGNYFRYAKAIAVEPLCLTCHGPREALPEAVKAQLALDYPFDKATGYSVGQLFGIVSIKRPH